MNYDKQAQKWVNQQDWEDDRESEFPRAVLITLFPVVFLIAVYSVYRFFVG